MTRYAAFCFCLISLIGCAPRSLEVLPVTRLAPPEAVRAAVKAGEIEVQWQRPACCRSDLAGYAVYISEKSLILAPVKDLPTPVRLSARQHSYRTAVEPEAGTLFVHVRGLSHSGKLSLPSLPEAVISTTVLPGQD